MAASQRATAWPAASVHRHWPASAPGHPRPWPATAAAGSSRARSVPVGPPSATGSAPWAPPARGGQALPAPAESGPGGRVSVCPSVKETPRSKQGNMENLQQGQRTRGGGRVMIVSTPARRFFTSQAGFTQVWQESLCQRAECTKQRAKCLARQHDRHRTISIVSTQLLTFQGLAATRARARWQTRLGARLAWSGFVVEE
jgi:hypothetical protein